MKNINVVNVGYSETFVKDNNRQYFNEMEWEGNYDGERAKLNINMNDNGKKEHVQLDLNNKEIMNMLKYPSVNKPIDERLSEDYLGTTSNSNHKKSKRKSIRKKKSIRKRKRKSLKKSEKV